MRFRSLAFVCLLAVGCGDGSSEVEPLGPTCDPLASVTRPTSVQNVVAVGQGADGVLYVLASSGSDGIIDRVFVSEGDTLVRRRVTDAGFSGGLTTISDDTVSYDDAQPSRLVLKSGASGAIAMALVRDNARTFYDDLGANKVELTLQPASVVTGKPVRNLPTEVVIEALAITADGQNILVTRPSVEWTYSDWRLYLGRDERLLEIPISEVARAASTFIRFTLNAKPGLVLLSTSASQRSLIQRDDGEWPLTELPTAGGIPKDWRITCATQ